jgi:hypothetical protein
MSLRDSRIKSVDWFCCIAIGAPVTTVVVSEEKRDSTGK